MAQSGLGQPEVASDSCPYETGHLCLDNGWAYRIPVAMLRNRGKNAPQRSVFIRAAIRPDFLTNRSDGPRRIGKPGPDRGPRGPGPGQRHPLGPPLAPQGEALNAPTPPHPRNDVAIMKKKVLFSFFMLCTLTNGEGRVEAVEQPPAQKQVVASARGRSQTTPTPTSYSFCSPAQDGMMTTKKKKKKPWKLQTGTRHQR